VSALYVYGVVPAAATIDAPTVELLREDGLAAVVGRVPLDEFGADVIDARLRDPAWLEARVRAHHDVLDSVLQRTHVVPLRFGAVFETEEHVRRMLRERNELPDALERVRGCVELGVKAFPRAEPQETTPAPTSGAAYLRAKQRERADAARRHDELCAAADDIYARLAEQARDARVSRPAPGSDAVLNSAYLVPRDDEASFRAAAAALLSPSLRVEVTGPWPPYNFVEAAG
jgi:hypothetical protein